MICDLGDWYGGHRDTLMIPGRSDRPISMWGCGHWTALPTWGGSDVLIKTTFTAENFTRLFDGAELCPVLRSPCSIPYSAPSGRSSLSLFAALVFNKPLRGESTLQGLYLCPDVSPIIAMAVARVRLFDPFSGSANALLVEIGSTPEAINFFGPKPPAWMVRRRSRSAGR